MKKAGKYAIIAALALLTGCGGDTSSQQESRQTSTVEASAPEQTTAAQQGEAPAGVTGSAGGGEVQPEQTAQSGNGGIDLVSEKYSDFDDVFKLNGDWCSLADMLMTADEFKPEGDFSGYLVGGVVGERVILEKGDPGAAFFQTYTYDLGTGELKELCADGGGTPICYNDKYIVVQNAEEIGINVYDINTGELITAIPEKDEGRIGFYSGMAALNNDVLFFDSSVMIQGNGKILPAVFTCNLNSGKIELFKLNAYNARYGLGNVVMSLLDSGYDNYSINGTYFDNMGGFGESYYPVSLTSEDPDEVLGERTRVAVRTDEGKMADIGVSGYSYHVSSGSAAFNKNGLFQLKLTSSVSDRLIIGWYNLQTGTVMATRDAGFLDFGLNDTSGYCRSFVQEDGIWYVDIQDGQLRAVHIREMPEGENGEVFMENAE